MLTQCKSSAVTADAVARVFNGLFRGPFRTELVGGGDEPLYQPRPRGVDLDRITYREDFVNSALHEVAHWCLVGPARRRRVDYGYWYLPDNRDAEAQLRFQAVEARPQALEWLFADAAGVR
ncbi:MAG: elongation factor P hydroxylase, partial [Pseudomonadota bacterium]|nr:elongation factor P hydroxylase [Pseudomonadota bacterium]